MSSRMPVCVSPRFGLVAMCLQALLLTGCGSGQTRSEPVATAEAFVDAFYAWDPAPLAALVEPGVDRDRVLYYQGWAEAANYQVQVRAPCEFLRPGGDQLVDEGPDGQLHQITCAITVSDDFGQALGYTATDTFSLGIGNGKIMAVSFEGDDPPVFEAVFGWIAETRPEVFTGPCRDMFEGGDTPGECARAVAAAARAFAEANL